MYSPISQVNNSESVSAVALGNITKSHSIIKNSERKQRPHEFVLQDLSCRLLPRERVCNCLKKRIDKNQERNVMYNPVRQQAYWGNVQRCGSVWTCPVCSKKISENRKSELKQAVEYWKGQGKGLLLLTLTSPHTVKDSLSSVLARQKLALKSFFSDRKGRTLFNRLGKRHHIRSFEITYGINGWHPHYHILLFVDSNVDFRSSASPTDLELASAYYDEFLAHWKNCCKKNGLKEPNQHGLDIRDGSYAEEYISKFGDNETKVIWGIESEMTKGIVKRGRYSSLHPFDLLTLSSEDEEIFNEKKPSKLYQEYAVATKGKRQLMWSRGLKKECGIIEKSDEDIVNEQEKQSEKVLEVSETVFTALRVTQTRHLFLEWVREDVENQSFIEDLRYSDGRTARNLIRVLEHYVLMSNAPKAHKIAEINSIRSFYS